MRAMYPGLEFQGINSTAFGSQGNDVTTSDIPTWEFADSLSMTHGKHTIAVGFDYRTLGAEAKPLERLPRVNSTSITTRSSRMVAGVPTELGDCGTGNSVADFLLGYYTMPRPFSPDRSVRRESQAT